MMKKLCAKISFAFSIALAFLSIFTGKYLVISEMQSVYRAYPIPWIEFPFSRENGVETIMEAIAQKQSRFPSINILFIVAWFIFFYIVLYAILYVRKNEKSV